MTRTVADTGLIRRLNRQSVIDQLRRDVTASPSQLAKELRISLPTVMRVLDDLGAEGLVTPDGFSGSSGGRPPTRWRFNAEAHAIISIHVMTEDLRGVICDLNGKFLHQVQWPLRDGGEANLQALIEMAELLLSSLPDNIRSVRGIGIGVPSMVRQPEGMVVRTMDQIGWSMVPLRRILAERFSLPIFVDRERDLAVVAERGFGLGQGLDHLVVLSIGAGAGAGIIINGKLYRGGNFATGEVKWILDDPQLGGLSLPLLGHRQSLRFQKGVPHEAYVALLRIAGDYSRGAFPLSDFMDGSLKVEGVEIARQLMDYTTRAVASIISIVDPQVLVLSGEISGGGDFVLDVLRARLGEDVYQLPTLAFSELGDDAVILGAVMTVLEETTLSRALDS